MPNPSFILASASPRRRDLLASVGVVPDSILPANIDESPHPHEMPPVYAQRIAREKVQAIATKHPDSIILAADTIVVCGRRILPKGEDEATARQCLKLLSGRRHRVMTAMALHRPGQPIAERIVTTTVRFRRLNAQDMDWYIATGEWEGKAGSYAIQGAAQAFIPFINGSYSNVVGLPLCEAQTLLSSLDSTHSALAHDKEREQEVNEWAEVCIGDIDV